MAKKENHMEVTGLTKQPVLRVQTVKQAVPVDDLQTREKGTLNLVYSRYFAPEYKEDEYGGTYEEFLAAVIKLASDLVQPVESQIDALLKFATSEGYQQSKVAETAKGDYLTPELKTAILQLLSGKAKFAEYRGSEIIAYWKDKYYAGDEGAIKILAMAKSQAEVPEI